MIKILIKRFIKDDDFSKQINRQKAGYLTSVIGIILNIFLFLLKFFLGTITNSLAVISDGFNNLSDSLSNVITIFSYKVANRKADKEHPYGHGRFEYISTLVISFIIIYVGLQLLLSAIDKIRNPEAVEYNIVAIILLVVSIVIKLWMAYLNFDLGKKTDSAIMLAAAKDYSNDCLSTAATIASLIVAKFTSFPVDGILSLIVSGLILYSGYQLVSDMVNKLIGKQADEEVIQKLVACVTAHEKVLGVHDIMVHNYGPTVNIASLHCEVSSDENFLEIHDIIDNIEKEVFTKLNIFLTIHMDPIELNNDVVNQLRQQIKTILKKLDPRLTFHDFRMVSGKTHTNLIFDVVTPFDFKYNDEEIKQYISNQINQNSASNYYLVINFDRE